MNRLTDIFQFSQESPLIFTQVNFWIFFTLAYLLFSFVYGKSSLRNAYLLLVSLFFYYKTSGAFVLLLIFSTVSDFILGRSIYRAKSPYFKKLWVTLSVVINLLVLGYFKYAYFFTDSYNALFNSDYEVVNWLAIWTNSWANLNYFTVDTIILPVGISFFTFQTISYSVDIYRNKVKPLHSILDFGLYVSFFPQLVAGPIVRAEEFVPQIKSPTRISKEDFNKGVYLILKGLIKKMIFADFIAMQFLDKVFDAPEMYTGFANVMAMIGYSLQIYGDFSGYTDIAIGLALLLGFKLPVNFNSPYKALHCGEFWKRWHISLSTWLRDYLYIPLGGNRQSSMATWVITGIILAGVMLAVNHPLVYFLVPMIVAIAIAASFFYPTVKSNIVTNSNLMLTMLIGGLWHGASWKFVIWGGLNGLGIVVYKFWRKVSPWENLSDWWVRPWKILVTFLFITFTRIYFRGESMDHITRWYRQVWYRFDLSTAWEVVTGYQWVFIIMGVGYLTHWLPQSLKDRVELLFHKSYIPVKVAVVVVVAVLCYQSFSADFQPFIYFQF